MSLHELPAPPGVNQVSAEHPESSSVRTRVLFVLGCALAGAVLAIPAGWLWNTLADAPEGVVFEGDVFYDEVQLNVQAEVTLWFILIGVVLGIAAGLLVGLRGQRHGVVTVVAVLVLCSVAAGLSAWLGIHVFGPDEAAQVAAAEEGGEVSGGLGVDTWVAYLAWPVGGMIGALAAIAGWPREHRVGGPPVERRPASPPPPPSPPR